MAPPRVCISPAARQLAAELRRIRESAGLPGKVVAPKIGWSEAKLSRIERALSPVRPEDVARLTGFYQVPEPAATELLNLAGQAWRRRRDDDSELAGTSEVLAWAPVTVPLPLRIREYHEAVLLSSQVIEPVFPGAIRDQLDRNDRWQDRVLADENPVSVRAVLDESVLARQFGSPGVMAGQIRKLAALDGQDNVELKVLPLRSAAPSWLPEYTHTTFAAGDGGFPAADEVAVPALAGQHEPGSERDIWLYKLAWERLAGAAEPADVFLKTALEAWS